MNNLNVNMDDLNVNIFPETISINVKKLNYPHKGFSYWLNEKKMKAFILHLKEDNLVSFYKKKLDKQCSDALSQIQKNCQSIGKFDPDSINWNSVKNKLTKLPTNESERGDTRLGFNFKNEYLVKYSFSFGLKSVNERNAHLIQTYNVPLLMFIPSQNDVGPDGLFPTDKMHLFERITLKENTAYRVPAKTKYILFTVQKSYFSLNVIFETFKINFPFIDIFNNNEIPSIPTLHDESLETSEDSSCNISNISNESDLNQNFNTPSSTTITADIGNDNYPCSSASDDIGQHRPDIAVIPGALKRNRTNIDFALKFEKITKIPKLDPKIGFVNIDPPLDPAAGPKPLDLSIKIIQLDNTPDECTITENISSVDAETQTEEIFSLDECTITENISSVDTETQTEEIFSLDECTITENISSVDAETQTEEILSVNQTQTDSSYMDWNDFDESYLQSINDYSENNLNNPSELLNINNDESYVQSINDNYENNLNNVSKLLNFNNLYDDSFIQNLS